MDQRNVEIKKGVDVLNKLREDTVAENCVVDNKIVINHKEEKYRLRLPVLKEQQEIEQAKRNKYFDLIDDNKNLFLNEWIKKYKERNIDIEKMDHDIVRYEAEKKILDIQLAKTTAQKDIVLLKEKIENTKNKIQAVLVEKNKLLSYSIENQLLLFGEFYTIYVMLEKKNGDNWQRAFDSFDEFEKCDDFELINQVFAKGSYLLYG